MKDDDVTQKHTIGEVIGESACFFCKSTEIEYKPVPCKCFEACKKCAMKMATGGKCKLCKQYFTNMSHCGNTIHSSVHHATHIAVQSCEVEDIEILEKRDEK